MAAPMNLDAAVRTDATAPSIALWLQSARVKSLWISTIAVFAGGAVAWWEGTQSAALLLAWLGAVAVQAGTNLTNVYHNYKTDARAAPGALLDPRGSAAPMRTGRLTPSQVRVGATTCFAIAVGVGGWLTALFGWRILAMGIPGLLAGYFYAAPPLRLAYRALGVVTVFVFLGPVMVAGSHWVVTGTVTPATGVTALVIGLLAAAIMHINDVRDFEGDVAHGKRTLTTILGREGGSWALIAMTGGAYLALTTAVVLGALPAWALACWLTAPRAVAQARLVFTERDPMRLNDAWFLGVRLHTEFGALLVVALLAAGWNR